MGVALAGCGPTWALVGDLAFLHDANALLSAVGRGVDLTVVVVDNQGGGIFSFLPQASQVDPEVFERLWATPQRVDVAAVARAFGAQVSVIDTLDDLARSETGPGVRVLVVRTDRQENVAVHARLNAAVARAVGGTVG
ncbi:MAG: thiamine pyrophosphate-dependent enzyme [Acidimicrobiales bacterium]